MADVDYLRVLFKGILCGLLMFIAADYYKKTKGFLGAFVAVPVFILSGFEHSIADMFYFASAFFKDSGCFALGDGVLFILVVIIGNAIGGLLIPLCQKYMYENPPAWFKKE
jgi:formate/nitrite transporter FocA (FNT family)